MSQIEPLVAELKRYLRGQGLTYRQVAARLGISESSIKRQFSRRSFSLGRFEQICQIAGLELSDLVEQARARRSEITELTNEQETVLAEDRRLLLVAYLLITGWTVDQIRLNFRIDAGESGRLLLRLHRIGILELLPLDRVKLLTSRNFRWRRNGPIQRLFRDHVQREFFDSNFGESGATLRFVGGPLSAASLARMQRAIDRIADEFNELSRHDSSLPLDERLSSSAVFAIRPWEFSLFEELRRHDD